MKPEALQDVPVDLTNCDREPIHIPGLIQSFGALVAMSADGIVSRVSENLEAIFGVAPQAVIGQPLGRLFSDEAVHTLHNRIAMLRGPDAVERLYDVPLRDNRGFDAAVHLCDGTVIVEAEPSTTDELEVAALVRSMTARLAQTSGLKAFLREGARQVRALTGFDRVMVYRFDETGSGEVVAEALRPGVDSFLGLHYPASDIPAQARALYVRNIFRVIANVGDTPVPIIPQLDPRGQRLDLSLSVLRAVSPIHIEYLCNMGVGASLSISIIVEGRLWGLFACHHYSPRLPSASRRAASELFGQMFSFMLESRERREAVDYEKKARALSDHLMAAVAENGDLLSNAEWLSEILTGALPADGVGVQVDGLSSLYGLAPNEQQFNAIVAVLNQLASSRIFTSDCISSLVPDAASYAATASGLLAIPLSRRPRDYVVLFRAEKLRSVRWAGNPEKTIEYGPNGPRLTPRKSFEEWSELVRGKAEPFNSSQLAIAESLRIALLEVFLRLSDSAGEERRRANEKQELLIAELNHRVRNILALIRGLISQTRDNALSTEDFTRTLDDRVQALARAHDQITADRWSPARLIDLIETEIGAYVGDKSERVRLSGPNALVAPGAFTVLALVFHELITNAAKYGALSDNGSISVMWELQADGSLSILWREAGGPPVTAPTRRGFGSTIIERSVPFDLGGEADVQYKLTGVEARFVVPARHIVRVLPPQPSSIAQPPKTALARQILKGATVLLVEDSMIIGLDGEDALRDLGAREVVTAPTIARAKAAIKQTRFDLAVLDFNLGTENSLPVAEELRDASVPVVFATGYGDGLDLPEGFGDVPILKKPYTKDSLSNALAPLVTRPAD